MGFVSTTVSSFAVIPLILFFGQSSPAVSDDTTVPKRIHSKNLRNDTPINAN